MRDQAALIEIVLTTSCVSELHEPVREPRAEVYRASHETILAA